MINDVAKPVCYKDFYVNRLYLEKKKETPLKVKVGAFVGSAVGTVGAVYAISRNQAKTNKIAKNIFNINYSETDILGVALGGIFGGLIAGTILDEKKYAKAKTKEAMHQALANVVSPLLFIAIGQKTYEKVGLNKIVSKTSDKIKSKLFKSSVEIIPRLLVTIGGLVTGVYTGTFLSNKVNHIFDKNNKNRQIKPLDFMYHPDDIATTLVLSDKNGVIQKTLGKIIPPIFTICGYETGTKR